MAGRRICFTQAATLIFSDSSDRCETFKS